VTDRRWSRVTCDFGHHDRDFDRIAAITGQAVRWLEPADRA
jgi:hypothetical protein